MRRSRRVADASLATIVVELVGELMDADPVTLDPPLNEVIDADALDQLLRSERADPHVEFTYQGFTVSVTPDRTVTVSDGRPGGTPFEAAPSD